MMCFIIGFCFFFTRTLMVTNTIMVGLIIGYWPIDWLWLVFEGLRGINKLRYTASSLLSKPQNHKEDSHRFLFLVFPVDLVLEEATR